MWHSTVTYWQVSLNIRTKPGAEWWVSWNIAWGTVVVEYISGDIVYEDTNCEPYARYIGHYQYRS